MISLAYFLEANLNLLLFWGLYRCCFERLTFFNWNRFYLLVGLLLSLLLPCLPIPAFHWATAKPTVISELATQVMTISESPTGTVSFPEKLSLGMLISILYGFIAGFLVLKLLLDVRAVIRLAGRYPREWWGSVRIIRVPDSMPISSFFGYIFVPQNQLEPEALAVAIRHEQVHAQQWHTLDSLLVQVISAIFWFNPLLRNWKRAIATNHEYIADYQTVQLYNPSRYSHLLVSLTAQPDTPSTLHHFSNGQLKSRIIMLHRLRSKAVHRLRYLLTIPLLGALLFVISCEKSARPELVSPLPKAAYLFQGLVGTWTNLNRTTINANDGKTPRDFPERAGDVRACTSKLVLKANGDFQMTDEKTGATWLGTWESDQVGVSVRLHYFEHDITDSSPQVLYNRDGSEVKGPFPKTISLDVTSLKNGKMQAWQSYPISDQLSGGTIYYEYQKQ